MFQIPEGTPVEYNTGWNIILWELVIISLILLLPLGYRSASKSDLENVRKVERGKGWFGFLYAWGRLFFIFALTINNGNSYDLLTMVGYVFSMIGLTMLIFTYERYKLSKRGVFFSLLGGIASFITLTGFDIIPGIFLERNQISFIIAVASTVLLLLIANLYFNVAEKFPGQLRQRTIYEFYGLIMVVFGIILDGEKVITNPVVPLFFKLIYPPLMALFGVWLVIISHDGQPWAYKSLALSATIVLFALFIMHLEELGVEFYV
jgi:hypothetical protein